MPDLLYSSPVVERIEIKIEPHVGRREREMRKDRGSAGKGGWKRGTIRWGPVVSYNKKAEE